MASAHTSSTDCLSSTSHVDQSQVKSSQVKSSQGLEARRRRLRRMRGPWPAPMACSHGLLPWPAPMACSHGLLPWPALSGGSHGRSWPAAGPMAGRPLMHICHMPLMHICLSCTYARRLLAIPGPTGVCTIQPRTHRCVYDPECGAGLRLDAVKCACSTHAKP